MDFDFREEHRMYKDSLERVNRDSGGKFPEPSDEPFVQAILIPQPTSLDVRLKRSREGIRQCRRLLKRKADVQA